MNYLLYSSKISVTKFFESEIVNPKMNNLILLQFEDSPYLKKNMSKKINKD